MSSPETSSRASPKRRPPPPPVPSGSPVRHPRSFKLRFAAQHVPGHSYQSAVRPLKLRKLINIMRAFSKGLANVYHVIKGAEFRAMSSPNTSSRKKIAIFSAALVTDKFWRRAGREETIDAESEERAMNKVRDMFELGPRDKHDRPVQSSHEYGWWEAYAPQIWAAPRNDRRLHHGVRDSAWLKLRARELVEPPQRQR
ncbi:uncharacterized protein LOC134742741 [Cydia strobilella]|uniref:uncharacterized protein LOC134742741 n=1 Tax=Cydia strobilella TaxID=1100964 RepID=UPI003004EC96